MRWFGAHGNSAYPLIKNYAEQMLKNKVHDWDYENALNMFMRDSSSWTWTGDSFGH